MHARTDSRDPKQTTAERAALRVLLLQVRQEGPTRPEELQSFCDHTGLLLSQFAVLNAFDTPDFSADSADKFDALFIGGSSAASVLEPERYPFVANARQLIRRCLDRDIPVFASCFGFQLTVLELGGHITRDTENFEMGTLAIEVSAHATGDPVFLHGPRSLLAVSVHQESALVCPPGCVELARTEFCHAFRVEGRRLWAFQFHPELDRARLHERLTIYKAGYTDGDGHLERILGGLQETPESNQLVRRFVDNVLLSD